MSLKYANINPNMGKKRRKENLGIKLLHIRSPINMCFLTFVVGTSVQKWALLQLSHSLFLGG
jgi:hypothetical protein